MPRQKLRTRLGQLSWTIVSSHVRAYLTRLGGHLAPVSFTLCDSHQSNGKSTRRVQPYAIAPWALAQNALPRGTPALLRALRGDFFCCPFGANTVSFRGERHPPHGKTANGRWRLHKVPPDIPAREQGNVRDSSTLHVSLLTSGRGRIDKYLTLIAGHTAVYSRHVLTGMNGPMSLGHHALIKFPESPGSGLISTSRFVHAQVLPTPFEIPEHGGYQCLQPGATFRTLDRAPLACSGRDGSSYADLTRFPARKGFDDLVLLTADSRSRFAWTAVTFPSEGYVWFALRDPQVLRHTILWMSNGGRHYAPWNGRHSAVMGVEDVTAYFHYGLAESARSNPLSRRGFRTTLMLDAHRPTSVNYIMGVASAPHGFDRVARIERSAGGIDLISTRGRSAHVALEVAFLQTGNVNQ